MISIEKTQYLLQLPKMVDKNDNLGNLEEKITLKKPSLINEIFTLIVPNDDEFKFSYIVNQSEKNIYKLSLFLMQDDTKIGLLRVDFNGGHKNPDRANEHVPKDFLKYVGKRLKYQESHIHYNVAGYSPMSWAIPLSDDQFKIKKIDNQNDVISAFLEFNTLINLKTEFLTGTRFLNFSQEPNF
jgi:hypothetical protein